MSPAARRWTHRALRWTLAATFLLAAALKLADPFQLTLVNPADFVAAIRNYHLAPAWSLHALALLLPWVEIVSALALFAGRWTTEAASILLALLLVYITAIASIMIRGIDVHCGCFGKYDTSSALVVLLRDLLLLTIAAGIILLNRHPRPAATPQT
jgi:putative oxidoreductase